MKLILDVGASRWQATEKSDNKNHYKNIVIFIFIRSVMKEIIKTLSVGINLYDDHLKDNEFLILFKKDHKLEYKKITFNKGNFLHLTGLNTKLKPNQFYKSVKSKKIKPSDISIKPNGTTRLKLDILDQMHNLFYQPILIGDYDGFVKIHLDADYIIGNLKAKGVCIGLRGEEKCIPNSLLQEQVKKITHTPKPIMLTLKKKIGANDFQTITYQSKKIKLNELKTQHSSLFKKLNIYI